MKHLFLVLICMPLCLWGQNTDALIEQYYKTDVPVKKITGTSNLFGEEVKISKIDTFIIQFLVTAGPNVNYSAIYIMENALKGTKTPYEIKVFKYTKENKTRLAYRVITPTTEIDGVELLNKIKSYELKDDKGEVLKDDNGNIIKPFSDAYFIDKRGWCIKFSSL